MKTFIKGFFCESDGTPSSKRLIGIIGGLALIINMFINQSNLTIESVLILTTGLFGIAGVTQIFGKKPPTE